MLKNGSKFKKYSPEFKLSVIVEEDLIAENQRLKEEIPYLQAEMEYLKKLDALVRAEEQKNGKKRK